MTDDRNITGHTGEADPRLLDSSATDFESSLLRAALEEAPSKELSAKMLAPVAGGAAATAGGLGLLKWALSGAGVLLVGGAYYLGDAPADSPPQTDKIAPTLAVPSQAPSSQTEDLVKEQSAAPEAQTSKEVDGAHNPAPVASLSKKPVSSLPEEMHLLDQARSALKSRKDPAEALRLLRIYEHKFPNGKLRQEATVLRVSALEESGAGDRAEELKSEFLKANPKSAHKKQLENGSPSAK